MGGMQMLLFTGGYYIFELTGRASLLGIAIASAAIPAVSLALLGGVFADRFEKKRVIQSRPRGVLAGGLVRRRIHLHRHNHMGASGGGILRSGQRYALDDACPAGHYTPAGRDGPHTERHRPQLHGNELVIHDFSGCGRSPHSCRRDRSGLLCHLWDVPGRPVLHTAIAETGGSI